MKVALRETVSNKANIRKGNNKMNYCLSLYVAKGKSMACMTSKDGEIILKPKEYEHRESALEELYRLSEAISPDYVVFMETTGVYHLQPERFFKEKGKQVIVANALLVSLSKSTLRKTKTDKTDSLMLSAAYFNGNYSTSKQSNSLQTQSRLVESMTDDIKKLKVMFRMKEQICFPALDEFFSENCLYSEPVLRFIAKYPHPNLISKMKFVDIQLELSDGNSKNKGRHYKRAEKLIAALNSDLFSAVDSSSAECHAFGFYANSLLDKMKSIEEEKQKLIELSKNVFPFDVWKSFKGIGDLLAAYLTAELGDITRFENEKKLIAFCGLDPTIVQSGKSINYHGPISKRGDSHARIHLYQAIMMIIRNDGLTKEETDITSYYKKKRSDGKHHYAAVIACSTKLLRKMFYRCKDIKAAL